MSSRASLKGETRDHMIMQIFLWDPGYSLTMFGNSGMTNNTLYRIIRINHD